MNDDVLWFSNIESIYIAWLKFIFCLAGVNRFFYSALALK